MSTIEDQTSEEENQATLTRRRRKIWIVTALIVAGILGWEYREWLFSVLGTSGFFLLACVVMHFFMHRGHGNHR